MATEPTAISQKWGRLRTTVRSATAAIESEPKYLAPLKPIAEETIKLLSGKPSHEALEEIEYLMQRMETFVARWRPSPKPTPGSLYIQPQWAKNTDNEAQEALRIIQEIRSIGFDVPDDQQQPEGDMKIFISHSSADKRIAEAFVGLLRAALPLSAKDIRCTSVDGYKLSPGTVSDEQLRQEVFEAQAFLALLSPTSIQSIYVMFELGARWGAKRYLAPVMVGGLTPSALKAPLSAIHAVTGSSEGDLYQLIETLSERLNVVPEKPAAYVKALKAFVKAFNPNAQIPDGQEESSYETLVLSKLIHPGLATPEHNICVIAGRLFNKSHKKVVIDKVRAYDRNGKPLSITWSNRIDRYGNPEKPYELIGIVDSEDIFVRQDNGEEIEYCKLEIFHSLSQMPLIRVFDEYEEWIGQQENSADPKDRPAD